MAQCVESSLHFWVLSNTGQDPFSFHPVLQRPQTHRRVHSTRSWGPVVGLPAPLSYPVLFCIQFISEAHVPSFSSLLWVCSKLRPLAVPSLDSPFCTSLLTGGDLECACHSLKRLHVGVEQTWWQYWLSAMLRKWQTPDCVHHDLTGELGLRATEDAAI